MVLQCIRPDIGTKCLCIAWRGDDAGSDLYLSSLESFWHQFQCRWRVRRDCCAQGQVWCQPVEPIRYDSVDVIGCMHLMVDVCSGSAEFRVQDVEYLGQAAVRELEFSPMSSLIFCWRESVFGYITVLPGAFSAYRYIALQNDKNGIGPLHKYFLGEKMVRFTVAHHILFSNWLVSMVQVQISLQQICTLRRIVYVYGWRSIFFYALTSCRFFAGSSFQNVAAHGYCTTSSPLMQLQTCPTKFPNLYHNGVAGLTAHSLLQCTV